MTDPAAYMAILCPVSKGQSRYACKVTGGCVCEEDEDLMAVFERQQAWRSRPGQPLRWEPVVASIEDMG